MTGSMSMNCRVPDESAEHFEEPDDLPPEPLNSWGIMIVLTTVVASTASYLAWSKYATSSDEIPYALTLCAQAWSIAFATESRSSNFNEAFVHYHFRHKHTSTLK